MRRIVSAVAALAAVAAVAATPASAARTAPSYALSGIETGIPTSVGDVSTSPFAGVAFGSTAGFATWTAHVEHQSLAVCVTTGADDCITGGDFSLSGKKTITGTFTGGSIGLLSGDPVSCTTPTTVFAITGEVDLNRGYSDATFTAVLTHYQVELFGTCVPYFATVTGTFG